MSFGSAEASVAVERQLSAPWPGRSPSPPSGSSGMFGLIELARDQSEVGRLQLSATVSDILGATDNPAHINLIGDILIEIVRKAEQDLKIALAERLAPIPHAPRELMVFLANDEIAVANPVLVMSKALRDDDLIAVIRERSTYHRQAIASRPDLGSNVIESLIVHHDVTAIEKLLQNPDINLGHNSLEMLTKACKTTELLRDPFLARREISSEFAINLYWWVSQELRQYISQRFSIDRSKLDEALEITLQEILDQRMGASRYTTEMLFLAKAMQQASKISVQKLTTILRRGQTGAFIALYSAYTGLPPEAIEAMVYLHSGESLAITARAKSMLKPDFAAMFLLARAARPGDQVVDPRELSRVLTFFDQIMMGDAMNILQDWQKDPEQLTTSDFNIHPAWVKAQKTLH